MDDIVSLLNFCLPLLSMAMLAYMTLPIKQYVRRVLNRNDEKKRGDQRITIVCFTGGPCAGKTTSMTYIQQRVLEMDMNVVIVPEAATYLMTSGAIINMTSWGDSEVVDFQINLMRLQMALEGAFVNLCKMMPKSALIMCDRGLMDGKAYMKEDLWQMMLAEIGWSDVWLRDSGYDAVIHLVTAANGAPEHYGFGNVARYEDVKTAIERDNKLMRAWTGHPHLLIINNTDVSSFEHKVQKCLSQVLMFIGQDIPFQYFKKFLVKVTSPVEQSFRCTVVEVTDTFLITKDKDMLDRVQKRGLLNSHVYMRLIEKRDERQKKMRMQQFPITCSEYFTLCAQCVDKNRRPIVRKRVCFLYHHDQMVLETFYLDKGREITLLRIETTKQAGDIKFPKSIVAVREVTDDPGFASHIIAKKDWVMDPVDPKSPTLKHQKTQ